MIHNLTPEDLHELDYGVHMELLREWNEETHFVFGPAIMVLHGFYTRIIQEDNQGALIVATYVTNGEGDLRSLRIYTTGAHNRRHLHTEEVNKACDAIQECGWEYHNIQIHKVES